MLNQLFFFWAGAITKNEVKTEACPLPLFLTYYALEWHRKKTPRVSVSRKDWEALQPWQCQKRFGHRVFPESIQAHKLFCRSSAVSGFWGLKYSSPAAKEEKKTALWRGSETQVEREGEHLL